MSNNANSGVGLSTVLVAIFVTLKLTGVIDWSWWWVFSPWWISVGLIVVLLSFIGGADSALDRPKRGRRVPYTRPQDHDVSHIQPLDSIKNPRKN